MRPSQRPLLALLLCGLAALLFSSPVAGEPDTRPAEGQFPWTVKTVTSLPALDAAFQRASGWTGGDGTHSLALAPDLGLWLFGDTFFGEVKANRRIAPVMVHNSAAWYHNGTFTFFPTRADLLRPRGDTRDWYWPGDGALVAGHLELFCMRVRPVENGAYGFDFDWYGSDLLEIDNPRDEPTRWRVVSQQPAPSCDGVQLGAACAVHEGWFYAWGVRPTDLSRALYVARRPVGGGSWEWACDEGWRTDGRPRPLFKGAAPEMSVTPFRGGWLAVCSPSGLAPEVALRWAPRPDGPWSAPRVVFRAPEASQHLLVYGARAHPELGGPGLVVSYNCNAPSPKRLMEEASAYAPRFVRLFFGR